MRRLGRMLAIAAYCLPALCIRDDAEGNAKMSALGYLLCIGAAALVLSVVWFISNLER
jgi:hypothetical protein